MPEQHLPKTSDIHNDKVAAVREMLHELLEPIACQVVKRLIALQEQESGLKEQTAEVDRTVAHK